MRSSTKILSILASTGIILAATVAPAMAAEGDALSGAVAGGSLSFENSAVVNPLVLGEGPLILDGKNVRKATGAAASAWTVTDARGTGGAWNLQASATDFTSAAGEVDTEVRTIVVSNLSISTGTVEDGEGSDSPPAAVKINQMNTTSQNLLAVTGSGKGNFSFTPTFELSIPVNAFRSNFKAGSTGDMNPYVSTVTYTLTSN